MLSVASRVNIPGTLDYLSNVSSKWASQAALRGRLYAHGLLLGVGVPSGKGPLRVNVRNGNSVRVRSVLESELSHWKVEGGNFV